MGKKFPLWKKLLAKYAQSLMCCFGHTPAHLKSKRAMLLSRQASAILSEGLWHGTDPATVNAWRDSRSHRTALQDSFPALCRHRICLRGGSPGLEPVADWRAGSLSRTSYESAVDLGYGHRNPRSVVSHLHLRRNSGCHK